MKQSEKHAYEDRTWQHPPFLVVICYLLLRDCSQVGHLTENIWVSPSSWLRWSQKLVRSIYFMRGVNEWLPVCLNQPWYMYSPVITSIGTSLSFWIDGVPWIRLPALSIPSNGLSSVQWRQTIILYEGRTSGILRKDSECIFSIMVVACESLLSLWSTNAAPHTPLVLSRLMMWKNVIFNRSEDNENNLRDETFLLRQVKFTDNGG